MPTEQTPTPRPKRVTAKTAPKSPAASTPATNSAAAGKPAAGKPAAAASGAGPATPTKPSTPAAPAAIAKPDALKPATSKPVMPQPAPQPAPKSAAAKPATDKGGKAAKAAARPSDIAARMIDPEHRRALIAEAAYLRAERRSFAPGYEVEDWLNAESEIDTRLMLGAVPPIK
ncbi:MAG TPA: DUF2934 domain-containing protein [Steroidobacteraceae bacterium]|nr:DUF2934 domain-containing protein [Steroidobacteraceae bacterium]